MCLLWRAHNAVVLAKTNRCYPLKEKPEGQTQREIARLLSDLQSTLIVLLIAHLGSTTIRGFHDADRLFGRLRAR